MSPDPVYDSRPLCTSSPGPLSKLAIVQRERDRLEDELAELRGAVHDALDAETLDRTRGILRRAVR